MNVTIIMLRHPYVIINYGYRSDMIFIVKANSMDFGGLLYGFWGLTLWILGVNCMDFGG